MAWVAWLNGVPDAREYREKSTAMNSFHKPYYRRGKAEVRNPRTGETFERRAGTWIPTQEPHATGAENG